MKIWKRNLWEEGAARAKALGQCELGLFKNKLECRGDCEMQ